MKDVEFNFNKEFLESFLTLKKVIIFAPMDFQSAEEKRKLQLPKQKELRLDAYENAKLYKERKKHWHNK